MTLFSRIEPPFSQTIVQNLSLCESVMHVG